VHCTNAPVPATLEQHLRVALLRLGGFGLTTALQALRDMQKDTLRACYIHLTHQPFIGVTASTHMPAAPKGAHELLQAVLGPLHSAWSPQTLLSASAPARPACRSSTSVAGCGWADCPAALPQRLQASARSRRPRRGRSGRPAARQGDWGWEPLRLQPCRARPAAAASAAARLPAGRQETLQGPRRAPHGARQRARRRRRWPI